MKRKPSPRDAEWQEYFEREDKLHPDERAAIRRRARRAAQAAAETAERTATAVERAAALVLKCSFCGASQTQARTLIAGPLVYICDGCIATAAQLVAEQDAAGVIREKGEPARLGVLTSTALVRESLAVARAQLDAIERCIAAAAPTGAG